MSSLNTYSVWKTVLLLPPPLLHKIIKSIIEENELFVNADQWRTGEGVAVFNPSSPKFRSFDKAEPNFKLRGKYIRNNVIRNRVLNRIC
jgi:hypothetical protein